MIIHILCTIKIRVDREDFREELKKSGNRKGFTHVIFMDDDVAFDINEFFICCLIFSFQVDEENRDRPVAGRMFCMDRPNIQYTAAEKWNGGNISHVEFCVMCAKAVITGKSCI